MTTHTPHTDTLRVVIVGGGVAALETALALEHLAPEHTDVTLIAPNSEFIYRPMTVGEPFALGRARRYPVQRIASDAGAELVVDQLSWVDSLSSTVHTKGEQVIEYDALVLALGARARERYVHALTIDDSCLDETLHGLIQDIEGGYIRSVAFVSPGRMAWPLPLYELALLTAGRAYDMGMELSTTIITTEDSPLAIFGSTASSAVAELLDEEHIQSINSAYVEIPECGQVVVHPGDRRLKVDRVVALPELFGPFVPGIPHGEHGFICVGRYGEVVDLEHVYAAGDATQFPVKHGGVGAQQADVVAQSIAALAGTAIAPKPFSPVIRGILLTPSKPLYLAAHITGGHGFSSEVTDTPTWSTSSRKIAAKYLAPCLERCDGAVEKTPAVR